jgi:hypothetical protein
MLKPPRYYGMYYMKILQFQPTYTHSRMVEIYMHYSYGPLIHNEGSWNICIFMEVIWN